MWWWAEGHSCQAVHLYRSLIYHLSRCPHCIVMHNCCTKYLSRCRWSQWRIWGCSSSFHLCVGCSQWRGSLDLPVVSSPCVSPYLLHSYNLAGYPTSLLSVLLAAFWLDSMATTCLLHRGLSKLFTFCLFVCSSSCLHRIPLLLLYLVQFLLVNVDKSGR